jgi:hypothetical protein
MLRRLALAVAVLALAAPAATADTWLGGPPAPAPVKRALTVELRASTTQMQSLIGSPIPARAIIGASLDARHYVWAAPTDKGAYCMGMTGPHAVVDGDDCTSASGASWGSFSDCDGAVIMGGRIAGPARGTARALEIRSGAMRVRVALDPARHGFFIVRLKAALFRTALPRDRSTWPRTEIVDAGGRAVGPARVNPTRLPPPDRVIC